MSAPGALLLVLRLLLDASMLRSATMIYDRSYNGALAALRAVAPRSSRALRRMRLPAAAAVRRLCVRRATQRLRKSASSLAA
jgi:hypothetical protein